MREWLCSKHSVGVVLALVVVAGLLAGCSKAPQPAAGSGGTKAAPAAPLAQGVTADTILLGSVNDLTGPQSTIGAPYDRAYKLYLDTVNAGGGVNGRKIKLITEDSQYKVTNEINLYKKLRTETKVFDVVTTFSTEVQQALLDTYAADKNTVMPLAKADGAYEPTKPWIFATSPTYGTAYRAEVDYVAAHSPNAKVGIVYPDIQFGQDAKKIFEARAQEKKVNITTKVVMSFSEVDPSSQVEQLKAAGVDYVLLAESSGAASVFVRAAKRLDLKAQLIGNFNSVDLSMIKPAGSASEGFVGVAFYALPGDNVPGLAKLREAAKKAGISEAEATSNWTINAWVDAMAVVEALKRAGPNPTPQGFHDALEGFKTFDTGGLSFPLTYSKDSHLGSHRIRYVQADPANLTFKPISDWTEIVYTPAK